MVFKSYFKWNYLIINKVLKVKIKRTLNPTGTGRPIIGSNKTFGPISEKLPAAEASTIEPYYEPVLIQNWIRLKVSTSPTCQKKSINFKEVGILPPNSLS